MPRAFTRQLGEQPGIQLQPIEDRTGNGLIGNWDQSAAFIGRFPRGRIDRPFIVTAENFYSALGKPTPVTASNLLAETHAQAYEALRNGARQLIIARLVTNSAVISWVEFVSAAAGASGFSVTAAAGATAGRALSVKHLGCHNDGIKVAVHADRKLDSGGTPVAQDFVTLRISDSDGRKLHEISGSLNAAAVDEFGQSTYLPVVAEAYTDLLQFDIPAGASIGPTHDCYGQDASGYDKWAASATLVAFAEGGTGYVAEDYDRAVSRLRNGQLDFGYIMGGGTRAVALISRLEQLAYDTNRQFLLDVPGEYSVDQAIAFVQGLGFGIMGRDHYPQIYWAPIKALDPLNQNIATIGTSGAQVGFRCAKNARVNAYGLSQKQRPIAGVNGALGRSQVRPLEAAVNLTESQQSSLADARIIPVLFQVYASGSGYYFTDALTAAATKLSYRKLVTVAEMSSYIDEVVARYGREILMADMASGIRRLEEFLQRFFERCEASEWLVPDASDSTVPPFEYTVRASVDRPADTVDVSYWLHFNGLVRQMRVQQIIR